MLANNLTCVVFMCVFLSPKVARSGFLRAPSGSAFFFLSDKSFFDERDELDQPCFFAALNQTPLRRHQRCTSDLAEAARVHSKPAAAQRLLHISVVSRRSAQ